MEDFNHILLFKTDIKSILDRQILKSVLDQQEHIVHWTIDLYDEDYVLRIVSYHLRHQDVIRLINAQGYKCSEFK